jgi:hypothetical protein
VSYGTALRATALSAALFAALFALLSRLGDLWWERPFVLAELVVSTLITTVIFWLMVAYRKKVRST